MIFYAITAFINGLVATILGLVVYFNNRKQFVNKIFAVFCVSVALWSYFLFIWHFSSSPSRALFWGRALMVGAIFIAILFFHFVIAFLDTIKKYKKVLIFGYIIFTFFLLTDFTPYFVKGVSKKLYFEFWPDPGILYAPFLVLWYFYVIFSLHLLFKKIRVAAGPKKAQTQYVFFGAIIGFIFGGTSDYFLWYGISLPPYTDFLVSVGLGILAYGIVKHKLFDIKLLLTQFLVAVFAILLFSQIFISKTTFEYVWHITLFIIFLFIGYLLIREVFREIENKKDIAQMNEELNRALEKETGLKENFRQVAEERQNKIWDLFSRPEHIVSFELRGKIVKLAYTLEDAQKENKELKAKIKELEGKDKGEEGKKE